MGKQENFLEDRILRYGFWHSENFPDEKCFDHDIFMMKRRVLYLLS